MTPIEGVLESSKMVHIEHVVWLRTSERFHWHHIQRSTATRKKTHCTDRPPSRAFVDLEEAYDRAPKQVLLWLPRSLCVEEWTVRAVQGMYCIARSRVRLNGQNIEEFNVGVGVYQSSVLSPLLFSVVLEARSPAFTQR